MVIASNVNFVGNGTITVIEENFSTLGTNTLVVKNWVIQGGILGWLHHTVEVAPQVASPGSKVEVVGTSFGAHEQVAISFDGVKIGQATTDSNGGFAVSITIPKNAHSGAHSIQLVGQSSRFSPKTVFYI